MGNLDPPVIKESGNNVKFILLQLGFLSAPVMKKQSLLMIRKKKAIIKSIKTGLEEVALINKGELKSIQLKDILK